MRRFHCAQLPASGEVWLDGDEGRHLAKVLRARQGDRVALMDGRGRQCAAQVQRVERGRVLLVLGEALPSIVPARRVVLLTAVPRGARMEWLVEKAVEAGVAALAPLVTERGVRAEAGANVVRRWERAALEAAKQCGRADVPEIAPLRSVDAALRAAADVDLMVATPGAVASVESLIATDSDRGAGVVIGPEGGFTDDEHALLDAAGARRFGLGRFVLRIETAALIAVHRAAW